MVKFEDIDIILLDRNPDMIIAWDKVLKENNYLYPNIRTACCNIQSYLEIYSSELAAIACPANSFGLMDGGWDGAVRNWFISKFGKDIIPIVQGVLKDEFAGEQPVGSSIGIPISTSEGYISIIHTPTMRRPQAIVDPETIYHCTRAAIIEAMHQEYDKIILPAFGGCCGRLNLDMIAYLMEAAFRTFVNNPSEYSWNYVQWRHPLADPSRRPPND